MSSSPTLRRLRTLEALWRLCVAMVAIRIVPVRKLIPPDSTSTAVTAKEQALAIRGAIRSAVSRLPIKPACLAQSLAAVAMLRKRGIAYRLHIGARQAATLEAHAWVEAAGLVVAGEGDTDAYSVFKLG